MKLNLRDLPGKISYEEVTLPFKGTVELCALRWFGRAPFPLPVELEGVLSRRHGEARVDYTARFILCESCARCLKELRLPEERSFSHPVSRSEQTEDDEAAIAPEGILDMEELAAADLLSTLSASPLCKEDCKGLCPVCGCDLNATDCDCT
jgi:uncharacterized protein